MGSGVAAMVRRSVIWARTSEWSAGRRFAWVFFCLVGDICDESWFRRFVACSLLAPAGGELLFLAIVNRFLYFFFCSVVQCRIGDIKMGARWGEGVDLPRAEVPFGL